MKEVTSIEDAITRLWFIRHGDTELANFWLAQIARKLIENRPLDRSEASILASALLECATHDVKVEAAMLFNHGKKPHASNRLNENYDLYLSVKAYIDSGKSLDKACELVGEKLHYPHGEDDDPVTQVKHRYHNVQRSIKELSHEIQEQQAWQGAFDEYRKTFDPEAPTK